MFLGVGRRLADYAGRFAAVVVVVGFGSAILLRILPGDPAITVLGRRATAESLAALRHEMGLDQPLLGQLTDTVWRLLHFDLGNSLTQPGRSVAEIILPGLGVTLALAACALAIAVILGIPLGLIGALSRSPGVDATIRLGNVALLAFPPFFTALMLLLIVALGLGLAPAGGWAGSWPDNLGYIWLPSLALSTYLIPLVARTVGHAARETMRELYIDAAIARGLPRHVVIVNHILPNSLLPVITLIGYSAAALIGGAVVIEAVFALPGIGYELVSAVLGRDFPVVLGITIVTGLGVVFINILTELAYALADPRVRRR